jgi:hypothetical protein
LIILSLLSNGAHGKLEKVEKEKPKIKVSSTSSSLPDCTWKPESGGDYYAANPSGARGKYQIMPITAEEYDCSLATKIGQEICAKRIYRREGTEPWVNCG